MSKRGSLREWLSYRPNKTRKEKLLSTLDWLLMRSRVVGFYREEYEITELPYRDEKGAIHESYTHEVFLLGRLKIKIFGFICLPHWSQSEREGIETLIKQTAHDLVHYRREVKG